MLGTVIKDVIFWASRSLTIKEAVGMVDAGGKQTVLPTERERQGASAPNPYGSFRLGTPSFSMMNLRGKEVE